MISRAFEQTGRPRASSRVVERCITVIFLRLIVARQAQSRACRLALTTSEPPLPVKHKAQGARVTRLLFYPSIHPSSCRLLPSLYTHSTATAHPEPIAAAATRPSARLSP
jgi:hypothetical protein